MTELPSDPYWICFNVLGDAADPSDAEKLLRQLAEALIIARVRDDTILKTVQAANMQRCGGAVHPGVIRTFVDEMIVWENREDLGLSNEQTRAIQNQPDDLARALRTSQIRRYSLATKRGLHTPIYAWLRATLKPLRFDPDALVLEALYWPGPRAKESSVTTVLQRRDPGRLVEVRLPLGGDARELQNGVGKLMGGFGEYARAAHLKAKIADVHQILWGEAVDTPPPAIADSKSRQVQLVETILSMSVWMTHEGRFASTKSFVPLKEAVNVFHEVAGVGLFHRESKDNGPQTETLYVHFPTLANGNLKAAAFRNTDAAELLELFRRAPGFAGASCPRHLRHRNIRSTYALDCRAFSNAVDSMTTEAEAMASKNAESDDPEALRDGSITNPQDRVASVANGEIQDETASFSSPNGGHAVGHDTPPEPMATDEYVAGLSNPDD